MYWWIDEPGLRGSRNPTDAELSELARQGVTTVIALLLEAEQAPAYSAAHLKALRLDRYSVPVPDFAAPTVEQFYEVLALLRVRSRQGGILLHCQGGCGRTGTVAAAYWISKGLSPEDALQKVRRANPSAVETREQEESLYEFAVHFARK